MKYKINIGIFIFVLIIAIVVSSIGTYIFLNSIIRSFSETISHREDIFSKIIKADDFISMNFPGGLHDSELAEGMIRGYMDSVDDKSALYLNKADYRAYMNIDKQAIFKFTGLSTESAEKGAAMLITYVAPGSPAEKAGLIIGDVITSVKNTPVAKLGYYVALHEFQLKEGFEVVFEYTRDNVTNPGKLVASAYEFPSITATTLPQGYGYIRIQSFSANTAEDFNKQITAFKEQGVAALVLDMRNLAVGDLNFMADTLRYILPEGNMLSLRLINSDEKSDEDEQLNFYCDGSHEIDLPTVVLVNQYTSFTGELAALAISDSGKASLVGERTAGYQAKVDVISMGDETAFRIATGYYYTVNNEVYDNIGIVPAARVEIPEETAKSIYNISQDSDAQLQKAASVLDNIFSVG